MTEATPVDAGAETDFVDWRKSPPEVKRIFDREAKDGFMEKERFVELLETIDPGISEADTDREFDRADLSKAGKLCYEDFYQYFVNWETLTEQSKDAVKIRGKLADPAVYVRVRPLASSGGHAAGAAADYTFDGFDEKDNSMIMSNRGRPRKFSFAKKVLSECSQQDMYDTMMPELVNSFLLRSMDVMLLAYGQTGTGKTHTMFGPPSSLDPDACPSDGPHPEWGIFPRVVEYTLSTVASATQTAAGSTLNSKLMVSAMEFYMMGAFDLLNSQAPVFIEDGRPQGLTEREIKSSRDMCVFLQEVYGQRHVRKTDMNEGSSRSHTALILKAYFCDSKDGDYIQTSFTLFDLAGAERVGKTGGKFLSPMDAMTLAYKGKDPGAGGEGAIINWDLSSMMDQVEKATDAAKKKKAYKCGTAMMTPAMQTICSCFDGRALLGMIVCLSQSQQHGSESWFSCTMGERLAALRSPVKAQKMGKIESTIKDRETRLKKAEESLRAKPTNKFAPAWRAQITGLGLQLSILHELKKYDPAKDQVPVFVRKQLGLYADLEEASAEERAAKVRECFEQADTNKDNVLCLSELQVIFKKLGTSGLTEDHIEGLFKQIDADNDGKVTFDEFFGYLFS